MSRQQPLTQFNIKLADAISTGASFDTSEQDVRECTQFTIYYTWTGSSNGYVRVQTTPTPEIAASWVTISGGSVRVDNTNTAGAVSVSEGGHQYIRVSFERVSGTGTLSATISGKRI